MIRAKDVGMNRLISRLSLLSALFAVAFAAHAQKVYRVAFVATSGPLTEILSSDNPATKGLRERFRALGYVEGRNLVFEWRTAEGKLERLPGIMRELLSIKVDAILTSGNSVTRAAKDATRTVPIVMLASVNPVEDGLVQSLARPGGNVTGLTVNTGPENLVKQVQLLREIFPKAARVVFLTTRAALDNFWKDGVEEATRAFGVKFLIAEHTLGRGLEHYRGAFDLISRERPDAVLVGLSPTNFANRQMIVEFAAKNAVPAAYPMREFADAGGLIAQGVDLMEVSRRAVEYVDRIFKGAKPADLPVERPAKFELVINLRTAKTLGVSIPPSVLVRADHVIQ
jgi:putative ABC transport system substrate-binding protein